jgi:hypothetical protein
MAIAVTLVSFDRMTGEILDADIELNERGDANPTGFHFTVATPTPDDADLSTILLHEMGHFQGVGHSDVSLAVMWPQAGLGEERRDLRYDDALAICAVYDPTNRPSEGVCDTTPRGGFDPGGSQGCQCNAQRGSFGRAGVWVGVVLLSLAATRARSRRRARRL